MEGPIEVKHSTATAEEPIKSEAPVANSDSSERSDGAASPPPNCSICLGKLVNTSFTDSCLHQFCFTCLLQWSKIKTECPLCKQTFKSIIHNVRSEEDYDQYHVPRELASQIPQSPRIMTFDFNLDVGNYIDVMPRIIYRTTMTGNRRHGTLLNPEQVARREQLPSIAHQGSSTAERRRRRADPMHYRRTVYRHGIWASLLPDIFGRFRESSAEYYRRQPRELDRLVPWINRELQVLLNNESHIAYVMGIIMDSLTQYDIRSTEFRNAVYPFFTMHTDHFVHELLNFARTNFDLVGYDLAVTYMPRLSNEFASRVVSPPPTSNSSSSSITSDSSVNSDALSGSDVRILEEAIDLRVNAENMPNVLPLPVQPGPSTVGQLLHNIEPSYTPELLVISSNSSESDGDCEIIGYVKPRHERTPEIIELLSSDPESVPVPRASNENTQSTSRDAFPENLSLPSTSYARRDSSCSSSSVDSFDINYYVRQSSRRSRNRSKKSSSSRKTVEKKHKRTSGTKNSHNKRLRNRCSSGESDFKKRGRAKTKNRGSSSSDSSSSESSRAKFKERRSRKARCNARERIKLIKKEEEYSDEENSCDCDSSSTETDSKTKSKRDRKYIRKRKHSFSSSDYTAKTSRTTRSKETFSALERLPATSEKVESSNKDSGKYSENRQSRSRSTSMSSHASGQNKLSNHRHQESRNTNEYRNQDDSASVSKVTSRRQHESKSKNKSCYSSDSENDRLRSCSQCSTHSSKSYSHRRRTKHKERSKDKSRDRSNNKTFNSQQSNTGTGLITSTSTKNDSIKHSECTETNKLRITHKKSKHKKSQSEKSRSRKKRRRIRSFSVSQSE